MDPLSQADDDKLRILTRRKVSQLLGDKIINPFIYPEEQRHPWSVNKSQELDCPLLRIWDIMSGSQPDEDNRMLSRLPNQPLNTEQARKDSLAIHLDHKNWTPTPYTSFTKSASAIGELAKLRMSRKRGVQTLTVIDPAVRLRSGLPILDVAAEMEYYCIPDPYKKGSKYYIDHYVCLWEVTAEEIVGHCHGNHRGPLDTPASDPCAPALNPYAPIATAQCTILDILRLLLVASRDNGN
ncbi:hypothetical protein PtrEW7m1_010748 [Pyrenophora tritici-repentis]|nr:hypothetical protein PtrEW7m1_010748 [Pyrenophora tritici-repentis]